MIREQLDVCRMRLHHSSIPGRSVSQAISLPGPQTIDESLNVDDGEREAVCLPREINAVAILMDDRKGRAEATRCGLRVAGTIGILEAAGRLGLRLLVSARGRAPVLK